MHAYLGAVELEDEIRVAVGDQRCLVESGGHVDHGEDAQPGADPVQVPEGAFEASEMCEGHEACGLVALFRRDFRTDLAPG